MSNENFLQNLKTVLNENYNESITENGAVGYKTSGKELLDLNFSISSLRDKSEEEIEERYLRVYAENPLLAIKWLFFAGDAREGIGERRLFRIGMKWLAKNHNDIATLVLPLIPEYTRWDNVLCLLDTELKDDIINMIRRQLNEDMEHLRKEESISLLGKWLPSNNTSSEQTRTYAKLITKELGISDREYRKLLSKLRAYLKVVEVSMSKKEYAEIDYSKVPSRANLIYNKAFFRNDEERRKAFLDSLAKGETKINAGVLFPHDIVNKYSEHRGGWWSERIKGNDTTLEELWKALPDFVNGNENTICVADGSGSMCIPVSKKSEVRAIDVARALAIYFSERSAGTFKDKYITFSEHPELVDFSNCNSLREKLMLCISHDECENTNIEAVFDLILESAIETELSQEEIPHNIVIISDMEFDSCAVQGVAKNNETDFRIPYFRRHYYERADENLFKTISKKYEDAGYKLPRLVFWNINSRTNTIPVKENDLGVALVSGFSPSIAKMVLSNSTDPFDCLLEQINGERYQAVEDALAPVMKTLKK